MAERGQHVSAVFSTPSLLLLTDNERMHRATGSVARPRCNSNFVCVVTRRCDDHGQGKSCTAKDSQWGEGLVTGASAVTLNRDSGREVVGSWSRWWIAVKCRNKVSDKTCFPCWFYHMLKTNTWDIKDLTFRPGEINTARNECNSNVTTATVGITYVKERSTIYRHAFCI